MLKIGKAQIKVLETVTVRQFQDDMVEHLRTFTPQHWRVIGENGVREVVVLGTDRATAYGFTQDELVRFYIELMFMLGSDFDTDPQFPWVSTILKRTKISQFARADELYGRTMNFVGTTAGPNYQYAIQALRRARTLQFEALAILRNGSEKEVLSHLADAYPEKCRYVGAVALKRLVASASNLASQHSIASPAGIGLFILLAFILGHGFASDPQFPWVRSTLGNEKFPDADVRAQRLGSKAAIYLDRVLTYHGPMQ